MGGRGTEEVTRRTSSSQKRGAKVSDKIKLYVFRESVNLMSAKGWWPPWHSSSKSPQDSLFVS